MAVSRAQHSTFMILAVPLRAQVYLKLYMQWWEYKTWMILETCHQVFSFNSILKHLMEFSLHEYLIS